MYDASTRSRALSLARQGLSLNAVSKQTGVSRSALRSWLASPEPKPRLSAQTRPCFRCAALPASPPDVAAYAYLLGLYLGDGCISPQRRKGYNLRIFCADAWPGLIALCTAAVSAVRPENGVWVTQKQGCVEVGSYDRHWPCLFPQHGPGKKHERPIVLERWQQDIVTAHPWAFLRGLVHSDGCRITNWTTRVVAGVRKRYEYPRYLFTNRSTDVLRLYTETLDLVGVEWKSCHRNRGVQNISVARRASVALMDVHIGPKH
ncbi:transcriptional regulator [Streptomyces montanisoli]|uniref:Transcriptional regulator n=1 Tax=Streptomyces montanisoli TaxID=2798581 RepID=A0A940MFZ3_9ACTN|nr:transcriptional regulator [Streptomyces montanisoli]MBP0460519.1 transcriptional regulator [Streptomyces montanisoli]